MPQPTPTNDAPTLLLLGRLDGKLDAVLLQQTRTERTLVDIDKRVRTLENGWAKLLGASAVASVFVSLVFQFITSK